MADPKILIAGVAALAYLLSGKKASASTSTKTNTNTPKEEKTPEQDGDLGELPGPNGCKPGYVLGKDGKCQLPDVEKDPNAQGGGTYSGKPSDLIISSKCDKFTFGDGTGEAWWKDKGYKAAKAWVDAKWDDSLYIAVSMLRKNKEVCFKDFPDFNINTNLPEDQQPAPGELEFQLINWIRKYPKIWQLVWFVRNKIEMTFFEGKQSVLIDPKTLKYTFGKKFDLDLLWDNGLVIFGDVLLTLEEENPGILLNNKNANKWPESNTATFLYYMLFPNLDFKGLLSRHNNETLFADSFWNELFDKVSELEGGLEFNPPPLEESKWV